jgi:hypothetical protein
MHTVAIKNSVLSAIQGKILFFYYDAQLQSWVMSPLSLPLLLLLLLLLKLILNLNKLLVDYGRVKRAWSDTCVLLPQMSQKYQHHLGGSGLDKLAAVLAFEKTM